MVKTSESERGNAVSTPPLPPNFARVELIIRLVYLYGTAYIQWLLSPVLIDCITLTHVDFCRSLTAILAPSKARFKRCRSAQTPFLNLFATTGLCVRTFLHGRLHGRAGDYRSKWFDSADIRQLVSRFVGHVLANVSVDHGAVPMRRVRTVRVRGVCPCGNR